MQRGHLIMFLLNSVASCQSNTTRFRDNQRPLLAAPEGAGTMVLLTPPAGDRIMLHCCIIAQLHLKIQPPYWPNSNLKAVYPPDPPLALHLTPPLALHPKFQNCCDAPAPHWMPPPQMSTFPSLCCVSIKVFVFVLSHLCSVTSACVDSLS